MVNIVIFFKINPLGTWQLHKTDHYKSGENTYVRPCENHNSMFLMKQQKYSSSKNSKSKISSLGILNSQQNPIKTNLYYLIYFQKLQLCT